MAKSKCDKCGKEVEMGNDATVLEAIVTDNPLVIVVHQARHLFETSDCEGSPSRRRMNEKNPEWAAAYEEMKKNMECCKSSLYGELLLFKKYKI